MNQLVFLCQCQCHGWVPGKMERTPDVTNVACAHVTWRHRPSVIRVKFHRIRVQNQSEVGCTSAGGSGLPKECHKWEWCPSSVINTCMWASLGLGRSRVMSTKVCRWIPSEVTMQESKVFCQMVKGNTLDHWSSDKAWPGHHIMGLSHTRMTTKKVEGINEIGGVWQESGWLKKCQNRVSKAVTP